MVGGVGVLIVEVVACHLVQHRNQSAPRAAGAGALRSWQPRGAPLGQPRIRLKKEETGTSRGRGLNLRNSYMPFSILTPYSLLLLLVILLQATVL